MILNRITGLSAFTLLLLLPSQSLAFVLQAQSFSTDVPSEAMFLTAPMGDANHVYTGGRKTGDIWLLDRNTGQQLSVFLDLPDATPVAQDGLLSMTFHPDYATNGLFYTYTHRNTDQITRITEYKRSTTNPLIADPTYERQILEFQGTGSHNGGWLGFSPIDDYLYITTGDNGANMGANNGLPAQDPFDLKGKLLRVDVNGDDFPADNDFNYSIPANNPFAVSGGAPEVFALGLRHPFRSGFDRATGDLYIGDVGSVYYDEVNLLPAGTNGGQNYGWRPREGSFDNPDFSDPVPPGTIDPIYEYAVNPGGASVIGGHVYRGTDIPQLQGQYVFGDFVRGTVWTAELSAGAVTTVTDRSYELFIQENKGIVSIGEDGLGELYVVDLFSREIFKLALAPQIPGDYNNDGRIGPDDFVAWRNAEGSPAGTLPNDIDGDVIDIDQYNTWFNAYTGMLPSTSIPEPSALILSLLGLAACSSARDKR